MYSQSEFTLEEGEALLKGMQELREELNQYSEVGNILWAWIEHIIELNLLTWKFNWIDEKVNDRVLIG